MNRIFAPLFLVCVTFVVMPPASAQSPHAWAYTLDANATSAANGETGIQNNNLPWDGGPSDQQSSNTGVITSRHGPYSYATGEASSSALVVVHPTGGSMVVQEHTHAKIVAYDGIYGVYPVTDAFAQANYGAYINVPNFNLIVKWSGTDKGPGALDDSAASTLYLSGIPGTSGLPVNWSSPSGSWATGDIPFNGYLGISASAHGIASATICGGCSQDTDDGSPLLSVTWSFSGSEPGDPNSPWWVPPQTPDMNLPFTYPAGDNGVGTVKPLHTVTPFALSPFASPLSVKYEVNGPNIATFLVPNALGGDVDFGISFNGRTFALQAGQSFDFLQFFNEGVDGFTLSGVDPGALQTLELGSAFTFAYAGDVTLLVTQVPEPSTTLLMIGTLLGFCRRRRRA